MRRASSGSGPVTLGHLRRDGVGLLACCDSCGRSAIVELEPLTARFGEAMTVPDLRGRFRCTRCGSRETSARPDYRYPGASGV